MTLFAETRIAVGTAELVPSGRGAKRIERDKRKEKMGDGNTGVKG